MKNIPLDKDKVIIFMGSMNAFPMMYALQLKKYGYEVLYFVDAPIKDTLSRPENHYPSISYPYPDWIIEWTLPLQIILLLSPRIFSWRLSNIISKYTKKKIGCYVLNGFFISLSPYLPKATFVALSHGSDLDVWANSDGFEQLRKGVFSAKQTGLIPEKIQSSVVRYCISTQKKGFLNSDYVVYFPPKFNQTGDKVIAELQQAGVAYIPRFHGAFYALAGQNRNYCDKNNNSPLRIFSGVRFLYKKFPRGNSGYNKGNDRIIEGLSRYYQINKNIKIDFVEKGTDLEDAKLLCKKNGLEDAVTWHKEMPFKELLDLYQQADVCFDQTGEHWISAIGVYALWLGKPLIANDKNYVDFGAWPEDNPVCSASSAAEVFQWLQKISDNEVRKKISENSRLFADQYLDMENFPNAIFQMT